MHIETAHHIVFRELRDKREVSCKAKRAVNLACSLVDLLLWKVIMEVVHIVNGHQSLWRDGGVDARKLLSPVHKVYFREEKVLDEAWKRSVNEDLAPLS